MVAIAQLLVTIAMAIAGLLGGVAEGLPDAIPDDVPAACVPVGDTGLQFGYCP